MEPPEVFYTKAFSVSVSTTINSKRVIFSVWTDKNADIRDDNLVEGKIEVDVEDDTKEEVTRFLPSADVVRTISRYDPIQKERSPYIPYSRTMKYLSLNSVYIHWVEEGSLTKEQFVEKSVQISKHLREIELDYYEYILEYSVNGKEHLILRMRKEELDLPIEELIKKAKVVPSQ